MWVSLNLVYAVQAGSRFEMIYDKKIPVEEGQRVEFSLYYQLHRTKANFELQYLNASGAVIRTKTSGDVENFSAPNVQHLYQFGRFKMFDTVQSGAVSVKLIVRKLDSIGQSSSGGGHVFFTHVYFGYAHAGQKEASPFVTGDDSQVGNAMDLPTDILANKSFSFDPPTPLTAYNSSIVVSSFRAKTTAREIYYGFGTITGLSSGTQYYVYALDPNLSGGSVSYLATTDRQSVVQSGAIFIGTVKTTTSSSTPNTGSTGGDTLPYWKSDELYL